MSAVLLSVSQSSSLLTQERGLPVFPTLGVDVHTLSKKKLYHVDVHPVSRSVQRQSRNPALNVDVGTVFDQKLHAVDIARLCSCHDGNRLPDARIRAVLQEHLENDTSETPHCGTQCGLFLFAVTPDDVGVSTPLQKETN